MFMVMILFGYMFGIIHKVLYSFNWVTWVYVALLFLVTFHEENRVVSCTE